MLSFYFQNYSFGYSELFLWLFRIIPFIVQSCFPVVQCCRAFATQHITLRKHVVFIDYYISLYVSFKELDVSVNLQRLGGGGHQHAFACLKGEGVALVISNGGFALNANEDNKAVKL